MAKDIEPKLKLISDYFKLQNAENFVIPQYQRGYSWEITQCDKLWQDIEDFINSEASDPYFFGTIIVDCSVSDKFSLIDGQQRTTTFLLLLKALLIRLQEVLNTFSITPTTAATEASLKSHRDTIIGLLYKANAKGIFSILSDWNTAKGIIILENQSINELYKEEVKKILESKDYDEAESAVHKISRKQKDNKFTNHFRNFKFFYTKLKNKSESQLDEFAEVFLLKCQIIEIRSWQIEQAITMFNSLNSTGLPLSDADIISADLFSNAGADKTPFNKQWEEITALASKLNSRKITNIDGVLQQFMYINRATDKEYVSGTSYDVTTPGLRKYYKDEDDFSIKNSRKKDLLKKPQELCDNILKIAHNWDKIQDFPIVKLLLKFNENAKIYLSSYLFRFDTAIITETEVVAICETLIKLFAVMELVDIGYSSSKFKTFLFGENIKLVDRNIEIQIISNDFSNHISETWTQPEIKEAILEYDKNILVFLNDYLYSKSRGVKFDFEENVNIEHIMPASGKNIATIRYDAGFIDTDKDKEIADFNNTVNKLGNKILLEEDINKSISNDWFKTKKQTFVSDKSGYQNSKYEIAKALTHYDKDTWGKDDIETATEKVAKRLLKFIFDIEEITL